MSAGGTLSDPDCPEAFSSPLWRAAESGDAATVASLMAAGSSLRPSEWGELSDAGDTGVLLAVLRGGYRPTADQLATTLIDATGFGGSEAAALAHTAFWLGLLEGGVLGEGASAAMAQRCGAAMCIGARSSCMKDGQTNLDPAQPKPELLARVEEWCSKYGAQVP